MPEPAYTSLFAEAFSLTDTVLIADTFLPRIPKTYPLNPNSTPRGYSSLRVPKTYNLIFRLLPIVSHLSSLVSRL